MSDPSTAQQAVDDFDATFGFLQEGYDELRVEHDPQDTVHAHPIVLTLADFTCLELMEMGAGATGRLIDLVNRAHLASEAGDDDAEMELMTRAFACRHLARVAWDAHILLHGGRNSIVDGMIGRDDDDTEMDD